MELFKRVSVSTLILFFVLLISGGAVFAVPLALEDFEAPGVAPGSINGQGNAGDWAGLWVGAGSGQTVKDVSADPLVVTLPDGTIIDGGNQAISVTGNTNSIAARQFGTPIDDEVYIGFLLRFEAGTLTSNDFVTLCFNDLPECTFSTIPTVGLKAQLGPNATDIMVRNSSTESEYSTKQIVPGETVYIVAHVFKTGGPTDNFDRINLWVNPDFSDPNTELNPDATADDTSTIADVDYIAIRSATLSPGDEVLVDGFQLATEWDDVFSPPPATVRISEVEYDAVQSGNDETREWIELYNYGDDAVNVSGWTIEDSENNSISLPVGSIIPANDYFLVANDAAGFNTNYPAVTPNVDLSSPLQLGDTGDSLTLKDTKALEIDFVAWENNVLSWSIDAGENTGHSICRIDPETDTDTVGDWIICSITTPKSANNTNTAPTNILVDGSDSDSVAENTPPTTTVSILSSTDVNSGDSHTYSLVAGAGDEDNSRFTIDGESLNLAFTPDFESPVDAGNTAGDNTYSIRIRSDDGYSGVFEKEFIITVTDVDEIAPITPPVADLQPTSDSGSSQTDNITNTVQPSFSVICSESGSTITLYEGANAIGTVSCITPGPISINSSSILTDGTHSITYTETDGSGNTSSASPQLNIVIDTTPPVLIRTGNSTVSLQQGDAYSELGATAIDAIDGDLTSSIITSGSVNTLVPGTYTLSYSITDTAGNTSAVNRTVIVTAVEGFDGDGDGAVDNEEALGPNGGDANGDGTPDSLQSSVASLPNPINSDKYVALQTSSSICNIINGLSFEDESTLTAQSDIYDFPLGLFNFTINCSTIGEQTTITFYMDDLYDTSDWIFVKYDRTTSEYQPFNDRVSYGVALVGSKQVTTMSYTITDGQFLDEDALANGVIVDPAGPAVLASVDNLEKTGTPALVQTIIGLSVFLVVIFMQTITNKHKKI